MSDWFNLGSGKATTKDSSGTAQPLSLLIALGRSTLHLKAVLPSVLRGLRPWLGWAGPSQPPEPHALHQLLWPRVHNLVSSENSLWKPGKIQPVCVIHAQRWITPFGWWASKANKWCQAPRRVTLIQHIPALAPREEWTKPLTPTLATRPTGAEAVSAPINQWAQNTASVPPGTQRAFENQAVLVLPQNLCLYFEMAIGGKLGMTTAESVTPWSLHGKMQSRESMSLVQSSRLAWPWLLSLSSGLRWCLGLRSKMFFLKPATFGFSCLKC